MSQDAQRMVADDRLTKAINAAKTPEEVRTALEEAMERGHIANRDPETGRFVPVESQPQQQTTASSVVTEKQPTIITKTEAIGGQEMQFTGTELEVEREIAAAYRAANAVKQQFTNRKSAEHVAFEKAEAERLLKTGQITAADYLERTGAIESYLRERGVDIAQIADERYTQSWKDATTEFLQDPSCDWPGGERNREILGMTIASLGLEEAQDKVSAIRQAYAVMKEKGLVIATEPSAEVLTRMTEKMTPQQILQEWKEASGIDGDSEAANAVFIEAIRNGRSSGIFG